MRKQKITISVIGGHDMGDGVEEIAHNSGKTIAEVGAVLVCGGLDGVMKAASKGAKEAGGKRVRVARIRQVGGVPSLERVRVPVERKKRLRHERIAAASRITREIHGAVVLAKPVDGDDGKTRESNECDRHETSAGAIGGVSEAEPCYGSGALPGDDALGLRS